MGGPFWHGCCGWGTQTGLQSFHYVRFSSYAKWLRPQSGLYYVRQAWPLVAPPSYWHLSRVGAFVQLHLPGWWKLIFWLYLMTARGGPRVPWKRFVILFWGCSLAFLLSTVRWARWQYLGTQLIILLFKSPCLMEQRLYLSFTLLLASLHVFTPAKVALAIHSWWSTSRGCWHPQSFPQTEPMLV